MCVCVCVCVCVRKCLQGLWSYETMESSETEVGGRGWLRGTMQGLPLLVNRSKQVPVSLDCVIWRPGTRLRDTQYGKGLIAHCCLFTGRRWSGRTFLFNIQLAHTVARAHCGQWSLLYLHLFISSSLFLTTCAESVGHWPVISLRQACQVSLIGPLSAVSNQQWTVGYCLNSLWLLNTLCENTNSNPFANDSTNTSPCKEPSLS